MPTKPLPVCLYRMFFKVVTETDFDEGALKAWEEADVLASKYLRVTERPALPTTLDAASIFSPLPQTMAQGQSQSINFQLPKEFGNPAEIDIFSDAAGASISNIRTDGRFGSCKVIAGKNMFGPTGFKILAEYDTGCSISSIHKFLVEKTQTYRLSMPLLHLKTGRVKRFKIRLPKGFVENSHSIDKTDSLEMALKPQKRRIVTGLVRGFAPRNKKVTTNYILTFLGSLNGDPSRPLRVVVEGKAVIVGKIVQQTKPRTSSSGSDDSLREDLGAIANALNSALSDMARQSQSTALETDDEAADDYSPAPSGQLGVFVPTFPGAGGYQNPAPSPTLPSLGGLLPTLSDTPRTSASGATSNSNGGQDNGCRCYQLGRSFNSTYPAGNYGDAARQANCPVGFMGTMTDVDMGFLDAEHGNSKYRDKKGICQ